MDNVDFDGDLPQNINRDSTSKRPNTVQLQTVSNNKRLKISSKTEKIAIENGNEEKFDYFSILPNEIIVKIFVYFDLKTLARTAQVCSRFNDIVTKTDHFYYNLDFQPYKNVMCASVLDRFMNKTKKLKKLHLTIDLVQDAIADKVCVSQLVEFLNGAKNSLTHLHIDGIRITIYNMSFIKAVFACKELLELHLRGIKLILLSNDDGWFNADFIQCKNLLKLDLSNVEYRRNHKTLITILSETRKLKHLILDDYDCLMDNISEKLVAFEINLETWSSRKRKFTSRGLSLFQFHTNLEELDLSGCRVMFDNPSTFTFNFLAKCSRLKRLSLAGWKSIKDKHLVTVIENGKKLERVDISHLPLVTAKSIEGFLILENLKILDIKESDLVSLSQIEECRKE